MSVYDLMLKTEHAHRDDPTPENRDRMWAARIMTVASSPLYAPSPTQRRRLARLVKQRDVPKPTAPTALETQLAQCRTPGRRAQLDERLKASFVEMEILRAREAGLSPWWRRFVADWLLRGVT